MSETTVNTFHEYGVPFGYWPFHVYTLRQKHARVMCVVSNENKAKELTSVLRAMYPKETVVYIPGWNIAPYERQGPRKSVLAAQSNALQEISTAKHVIVVTTMRAFFQRYPVFDASAHKSRTIKRESAFDRDDWAQYLEEGGYLRVDTVRVEGEYSYRGGLIDIFPLGSEYPVRLDLFDTEIERLFQFDPFTQRRGEEIKEASVPVAGRSAGEDGFEKIAARYEAHFNTKMPEDLQVSFQQKKFQCNYVWLGSVYYKELATLAYQTQADVLVSDEDLGSHLQAFIDEARSHYDFQVQKTDMHVLPPEDIYLTLEALNHDLKKIPSVQVMDSLLRGHEQNRSKPHSLVAGGYIKDVREMGGSETEELVSRIRTLVDHVKKDNRQLHIATSTPGNRARLLELLGANSIKPLQNKSVSSLFGKSERFSVYVHDWPLAQGCVFGSNVVVSDLELLPNNREAKKRAKDPSLFIAEANALSVGDYVVHEDHGVGQFIGLESVDILGAPHECVVLLYQGDDKLFVPVENLDALSRFGNQDTLTSLDRLGHQSWQQRRDKVRKDLLEMAKELVKIAAEREHAPAPVFAPSGMYYEVVNRFPYEPTTDQEKASASVEEDLAAGHLMDRLVCGDVGFGKTEVAIRAAAQVAAHGAQVAIVVPTTLLARQHYSNFIKRFEGMPLNIQQLSRFTKPRDVRAIKEGLAKGTVDIVVGTHGLLHSSVSYKNLGLLIVDEEQHFGVKQKEHLKKIAKNLHILTLTATPIPRTLQMSLTGVRELSIMASPPVDRLPVYTQVSEDKKDLLREALLREKSRGGISFVVCPRLADLDDMKERLTKLLPDFTFAVANGQLHRDDLDEVMTDFADQKYDVLIATNIIESGLDIPHANTLIVHRADMFGLAQLYQLRGRVGRGNVRGYAYLTYPQHTILNSQARRRLEVMESLDQLGAGFQLASYDLDIRGAGNVLGEQQSGHIREVGVEMYQHMLQEALAETKKSASREDELELPKRSPQINMGFPVMLPESYVVDLSTRLELYRRSAFCETKDDLDELRFEILDRFGPLPIEAMNFFELLQLKLQCKSLGIESVSTGNKGAVIGFYNDSVPDPERLIAYIQENKGTVKLRPDQKLVFTRMWPTTDKQLEGLREILAELTSCLRRN